MKKNLIAPFFFAAAILILSSERVIASENISQKTLENKAFYQDLPLSEKLKNNFYISRFLGYFQPSIFSLKSFNRSFSVKIHGISLAEDIKTLPVYGYFFTGLHTKKAVAQEILK